MIKLAVRRLLTLIPLLLVVALCTFFLVRLAPGDYFSELGLNSQISEETIRAMRAQYGLDRPWYAQFGSWLLNTLRGDLGYSISCQCPVATLLAERVFNTVLLAVAGFGLALLMAVPVGILPVAVRSQWLDRVVSFVTSLSLSLPSFLLALLALVFAATTGWFPIGGAHSLDYESKTWAGKFVDVIHHLALPAAVLAIKLLPAYSRQLNASLREALLEEYIVAARARGLGASALLFKHALRNVLNPMITMFGQSLGSLLSGAFVVEAIMAWPGLGSLAVSSLLARDLDAVIASVLYAALLLAIGNLLADMLLAVVDPRIRKMTHEMST